MPTLKLLIKGTLFGWINGFRQMNFLISLNKDGMFFSGVLKLFIYKEVLNINTSEDEIKLPPKSELVIVTRLLP